MGTRDTSGSLSIRKEAEITAEPEAMVGARDVCGKRDDVGSLRRWWKAEVIARARHTGGNPRHWWVPKILMDASIITAYFAIIKANTWSIINNKKLLIKLINKK